MLQPMLRFSKHLKIYNFETIIIIIIWNIYITEMWRICENSVKYSEIFL